MTRFVWIVTEYRTFRPCVDKSGGEHIPVFVCSSRERADEYVDCLPPQIDWAIIRKEVHE